MKYAFFNDDGSVRSAHNDQTIDEVPSGAVSLSEEQWENRCNLRLVDGELFVVESQVSREDMEAHVRRERSRLLAKNVDCVNPIRWESMNATEKQALRDYRQALLDIPEQSGFPFEVVWPELGVGI